MGCAPTDHPGCGSSWHTPRSPWGTPHTLLPPQGESWGPPALGSKRPSRCWSREQRQSVRAGPSGASGGLAAPRAVPVPSTTSCITLTSVTAQLRQPLCPQPHHSAAGANGIWGATNVGASWAQ